jgi:hypothetical protein
VSYGFLKQIKELFCSSGPQSSVIARAGKLATSTTATKTPGQSATTTAPQGHTGQLATPIITTRRRRQRATSINHRRARASWQHRLAPPGRAGQLVASINTTRPRRPAGHVDQHHQASPASWPRRSTPPGLAGQLATSINTTRLRRLTAASTTDSPGRKSPTRTIRRESQVCTRLHSKLAAAGSGRHGRILLRVVSRSTNLTYSGQDERRNSVNTRQKCPRFVPATSQ